VSRQRPAKCCIRCGRTCIIGWNWPEGFVCTNCVRHGVRTHGQCPGCGIERSLPGLDGTGQPVCVDCAGIPTSFRCSTCGVEDEPFYSHTCLRCSLKRRLTGILDDGSGTVAATMVPFFDAMVSMGRPRQGLKWLNSATVRQRLTDLATEAVPLTHEGVDTFGGGPGQEYLRELLMAHGALAVVDKYLLAFERFERHRLETIVDLGDRQTITIYLRWRHHRDLVARSEAGVLTARTQNAAQQQTNAAVRLLDWMRVRHVTLAACTQEDVDVWFATTTNAESTVDFLRWAVRHRRCAPLTIPTGRRGPAVISSERHRKEVLGRLLMDEGISLRDRVVGCLVVLLAQPVTRICTLRIADVEERDGLVDIRLGHESIELPRAVGDLVAAHVHSRSMMATAANANSEWLFPGRSANQHVVARQLNRRMARIGISISDRQAALHQLVRDVPSPVVALAMGLSTGTTAKAAAGLGIDWAAYAALRSRQTSRSH
jgi:hypothetical protein